MFSCLRQKFRKQSKRKDRSMRVSEIKWPENGLCIFELGRISAVDWGVILNWSRNDKVAWVRTLFSCQNSCSVCHNNHQHKEPNTGLSFPRLLQLLNCIECEDKRRSPCIHSLLYLSVKRKPQKLLKLNKSLWGYSGSMKMYLSVIMENYLLMQMFLKAEM